MNRQLPLVLTPLCLCSEALGASGVPEVRLGQAVAESKDLTLVERLRSLHLGEPALLHAVPRANLEGYRMIIGRFPALNKPIIDLDNAVILEGVVEFINSNRDILGLRREVDPTWLAIDRVTPRDDFWTVSLRQQREGVMLDEAFVKVVFYANGDIYSLGGQLEEFSEPGPFLLGVEDALGVAANAFGANLWVDAAPYLVSPHGKRSPVPLGGTAFGSDLSGLQGFFLPLIDRFSGRNIWHFQSSDGTHVIVDDASGRVQTQYDLIMGYSTVPCNVRHFDFPRSSGLATSATASGAVTHQITCGGDEVFGTCYYQLRRSEMRNGLDRVQDDDSTEPEVAQACSSNTPVNFTQSSGGANFEEQSAFYFGAQARAFFEQNVYSQTAPDGPTNVEYYTDYQSGTSSRYNPFWHDIYILPGDTDRLTTIAHEQGHHALVTYGINTSTTCTENVNENETLHETFASVLALLYIADDDNINMAYNGDPMDDVMNSHTAAGNGVSDGSLDCNNADIHNEGLGLQAAVWELLHNSDCSVTGCVTQTGIQQDIWTTTTSHETVITNVGLALAFAFDAVPGDTTHDDIIAQMSARWVVVFGSATASRAMAVFGHHSR